MMDYRIMYQRTMIVHEDVGDTANEFKFKGNGNHYEQ